MIKIVGVRFKNAGKIYYFDPVELEVEKDMEVETQKIKAENGDILLLCSDGLTNMVKNEEILEIVLDKHSNLDECVSRLVNTAMENGGKDNITVVLVEVQNDGE